MSTMRRSCRHVSIVQNLLHLVGSCTLEDGCILSKARQQRTGFVLVSYVYDISKLYGNS